MAGETAKQTYGRHAKIIKALYIRFNSIDELVSELDKYSCYHSYVVVHCVYRADFIRVIRNVEDLILLVQRLPYYAEHIIGREFSRLIKVGDDLRDAMINLPKYSELFMERALTNHNDFARLFAIASGLTDFIQTDFPMFAERIVEKLLDNVADLARVALNLYQLHHLTQHFPAFAERIMEKVFANDDYFSHLILSEYQLDQAHVFFPDYLDRFNEKFYEISHRMSLSR